MAHCERWSVPVGNEGGAEQVPNLAEFCEAGTLNDHASTGNRHSHHELQGLNDTTSEVAPVRATQSPIGPSNTKNDEESEVIDENEEIEEIDKLLERVEELEKQLAREEEGEVIPQVADVETPTQAQIDQHELTHTPYRRWCKACNKGLAIRDKHQKSKRKKKSTLRRNVPDTEAPENGQTKYSMDYMTMDSINEEKAPATLVMVNHEDGGIFAYATLGKGIQGDKSWLPKRIAKDIDNCGTKEAKVQVKSDQEPGIVVVQEDVRMSRQGKTICINSPVGESECNGRAGNAVRQVQVKVRTFRAAIEEHTKTKMDMSRPFATWMIRWAGESITKYGRGSDGKTSWQRRRGESCNKPIAFIGENVL